MHQRPLRINNLQCPRLNPRTSTFALVPKFPPPSSSTLPPPVDALHPPARRQPPLRPAVPAARVKPLAAGEAPLLPGAGVRHPHLLQVPGRPLAAAVVADGDCLRARGREGGASKGSGWGL